MNFALTPSLAALATLALFGQERLVPGQLVGQSGRDPGFESLAPLDTGFWVQRLTSPDLESREDALEELLERASCDREAAAWLESLASSSADLELAWTARMALRVLACQEEAAPRQRAPHVLRGQLLPFGGDPADVIEELGEIERRFERLFGDTGPGPEQIFGNLFGAPRAPGRPAGPDTFGMGKLPEGLQLESRQRGVQVESGPDGIKIRVHSSRDGEHEVREFEGESLEAVLEANPGLEDELGLESPLVPGRDVVFGGSAPQRLRGFALRLQDDRAVTRTDVLGVRVTPVTDARAGAFGLEPGRGLLVEEVVPGTIARALGLVAGDVLVEINERPMQELDDISKALSARADAEGLTVSWLDTRGRFRERTWAPVEEVQPAPEPAETRR